MRLSRIKLAGFKSFVDPTTVRLTSNLTAVVGPNGSGKSNIIDAVRWVMGESSAKHLRGGAMADVIFNGSATRRPVSQASVELVFDNSDGRLGGRYARFSEISVKRLVNRDGQSSYYLNGTRCRRRDITDLFLGTGLGPRSYAIIEQGMISRLIEARPEELRAIVEEAAGISRYKERRRETETRIRNTLENLSRLKDIQEEVDKQLEKLRRQARIAERYKALRTEQRRLSGERLALEWRELHRELERQRQTTAQAETALAQALAEQRAAERTLEEIRERREEAGAHFNDVQARYYESGALVSTREQALRHARERLHTLEKEWERLETALEVAVSAVKDDEATLKRLEAERDSLVPRLERLQAQTDEARARVEEGEAALCDWQRLWERHTTESAEPRRRAEVARARIEHLEHRLEDLNRRRQRLDDELKALDPAPLVAELEALEHRWQSQATRLKELEREREALMTSVQQGRAAIQDLEERRETLRDERRRLQGRREALHALQEQSAHEQGTLDWLAERGLANAPTLAERLEVEPGWEDAVEAVLGPLLHARLVDHPHAYLAELASLEQGSLLLVADAPNQRGNTGLAAKVDAPVHLHGQLASIEPVSDLNEALGYLQTRTDLAERTSFITPDGTWLAADWLHYEKEKSPHRGTLSRLRELRAVEDELARVNGELDGVETSLAAAREGLSREEKTLSERDVALQDLRQDHARVENRREVLQGRREQLASRREQLERERDDLAEQRSRVQIQLEAVRSELNTALEAMEAHQLRGEELGEQGEQLRERLEEARADLRERERELHQSELIWQRLITQIQAREEGLARARERLHEQTSRRNRLEGELTQARAPLAGLEARLEAALRARTESEAALGEARRELERQEDALREGEQRCQRLERAVEERRSQLDSQRLRLQEMRIRLEGLSERLREDGHELEALLAELPEEADPAQWDERLNGISRSIERLGPINLAAIEEHRELSERKTYLDAQRGDLEEALATLESAIRRIDRETRARFKATFDRINEGLQGLFPRLFGGGQAHLELTGEDLLETGVSIMARPPGKRITNIHLLSGGEKALTAVALVFAIFQLNPAPFCMLDEVDAPLDEANVGRFCKLVQELSEQVQFIFITHNKATMEIAEQLNGVTMQEAGVSRLVTVDVAEAAELAAV